MPKLHLNTSCLGCMLNGKARMQAKEPYVNIYVRVANDCQANCKFCEFKNIGPGKFDIDKFRKVLTTIRNEVRITKISFTGGEPTINLKLLKKCLNIVKEIDPTIFTITNTNGLRLVELTDIETLDNISLSRHHYRDAEHARIVGTTQIASAKTLKTVNKDKIHLSCNLMRGHIDSLARVKKYLEHAARLGIYDVGFVGLMKVNQYCNQHYVPFPYLDRSLFDPDIICNKIWQRKEGEKTVCKCRNLLYLPSFGNRVVAFYYRERCKHKACSTVDRDLYFDGQTLKKGFYGKPLM